MNIQFVCGGGQVGEIRVLGEALANKIAAGEVVERPASVVRELVENSIDAGASDISVDVERAGQKLIRVSDNGRGMDESDALLSVQRHATSKLRDDEGLFSISSMGFRGEALPSIASVSRFRLTTAPKGADHGIEFELGRSNASQPVPVATVGTMVEVRDLFYNTPARRKFLKRDSTELLHIVETVTRLALSHPAIRFTLNVNGQSTMELPLAGDRRERLVQVYGTEFVEALVPFSLNTGPDGPMQVEGFVSRPSELREVRSHQMVFVNNRPVRDPSVSHAVFSAYDAPRGLHPVFFVFLTLDPTVVDVNVHPAKQEVRFSDKQGLYRFVRRAVGEAVRILPEGSEWSDGPYESEGPGGAGGPDTGVARGPFVAPFNQPPNPAGVSDSDAGVYGAGLDAVSGGWKVSEGQPQQMGSFSAEVPFVYLGGTFFAYPDGRGGMLVLDHHAAHERVLYEKLLHGLELKGGMLLFPRQVELSRKEHMVVLEHAAMFAEFGIEVEDFGGQSVIVRSLPVQLEEADLRGILADAVAAIAEGARPGQLLREAVVARIACHSSVRGSRMLGPEEFMALLEQLDKADDPEHCPHGRPTRLRFSMGELKKLFKRV